MFIPTTLLSGLLRVYFRLGSGAGGAPGPGDDPGDRNPKQLSPRAQCKSVLAERTRLRLQQRERKRRWQPIAGVRGPAVLCMLIITTAHALNVMHMATLITPVTEITANAKEMYHAYYNVQGEAVPTEVLTETGSYLAGVAKYAIRGTMTFLSKTKLERVQQTYYPNQWTQQDSWNPRT